MSLYITTRSFHAKYSTKNICVLRFLPITPISFCCILTKIPFKYSKHTYMPWGYKVHHHTAEPPKKNTSVQAADPINLSLVSRPRSLSGSTDRELVQGATPSHPHHPHPTRSDLNGFFHLSHHFSSSVPPFMHTLTHPKQTTVEYFRFGAVFLKNLTWDCKSVPFSSDDINSKIKSKQIIFF